MAEKKVVKMPIDPAERRLRRLEALWTQEDELETRLRSVRAQAKRLAAEVSKDRGYMVAVSRENCSGKLMIAGRATTAHKASQLRPGSNLRRLRAGQLGHPITGAHNGNYQE